MTLTAKSTVYSVFLTTTTPFLHKLFSFFRSIVMYKLATQVRNSSTVVESLSKSSDFFIFSHISPGCTPSPGLLQSPHLAISQVSLEYIHTCNTFFHIYIHFVHIYIYTFRSHIYTFRSHI